MTKNKTEEIVDNIDHVREENMQTGTVFMEVKRDDLVQALTDVEERGRKKAVEEERERWVHLLEHLYFVEGIEDIRHSLPPEWTKTKGEKICEVVFALLNEKDPEKMLENLTTTPKD